MKNRITKIAVILVLLMVILACVVACQQEEIVVESIAIKTDDLPKVNYLLGQPLDLSKGAIAVFDGTEKKNVPLNDAGVTVSGYDPDKLGSQTLTVSYGGKEVSYSVFVVPKVYLENGVDLYFVGESLDRSKGRLVIMDDNAIDSQEVAFSDQGVSVSGFSSATAGTKSLIVTYNGVSGTIDVQVYAIDSYDFKAPTKIAYKSYDERINPLGGYFILKGEGGVSKNIVLTAEMCDGYDNTAVNAENREVSQEITARYGSCSNKFSIGLKYSFLNEIKENMEPIRNFDLNAEDYKQEDLDLAVDLMEKYFLLDAEETKMLDDGDAEQLARIAAFASEDAWYDVFERYPALFRVSDGGIYYECTDYAETLEAMDNLFEDTEAARYEDLLREILKNFASVEIFPDMVETAGSYTLNDYFGQTGMVNGFRARFFINASYAALVYQSLKEFPAEWSEETFAIKAEEDKVLSALDVISTGNFKSIKDRLPYRMVKTWRNDFFDIIYAYLYANRETQASNIALMSNVYLPGVLEELFQAILSCDETFSSYVYALQQVQYNPKVIDGTDYLYYYYKVNEIVAGMDEQSDLIKYFFINAGFSGLSQGGSVYFDDLLYTPEYYFVRLLTPMFDDDETIAFLDDYMELVNAYITINDDDKFFSEHGKGVKALFDKFVGLSPVRQSAILTLTNIDYSYYGYLPGLPKSAFDITELEGAGTSYFAFFVITYFNTQVITPSVSGDDVDTLFYMYTLALEYYTMGEMGYAYGTLQNIDNFLANGYGEGANHVYLSADEIVAYNTHVLSYVNNLKAKLDHYVFTLNADGKSYDYTLKSETVAKEWQDKLDNLVTEFNRVITTSEAARNSDSALSALLVSYQVLEHDYLALQAELAEATDVDAVRNAFYYGEWIKIGNYDYTMANALVRYRRDCIDVITANRIDWEEYKETKKEIYDLYQATYNVMWQYRDGLGKDAVPTLTDVKRAVNLFADNLDAIGAYYIYAFDIGDDAGYYTLGVLATLKKELSAEAYNAAEKLFDLQGKLNAYLVYKDYYEGTEAEEEALTRIIRAWGYYESAYDAIKDADAKAKYDEVLGYVAKICKAAYGQIDSSEEDSQN